MSAQCALIESVSRYQLDQLGWLQFEELCQSLLKARFAVGIQSWGGSGDRGRDASYEGRLPIPDKFAALAKRSYTFQVKFVSRANAVGSRPEPELRKAVEAEKTKLKQSKADCYVLLTNVPVGPTLHDDIQGRIREVLPRSDIVIWGEKDISDLLDATPALRTAFPQLLSIRDLQFLVLDAIRKPHQERARAFLERAREIANTFVPTSSYAKALDYLSVHNIAVLSGPPEMGKTTTASVVGLAKAAEGWQCFEVRNPHDFFELLDRDAKQLFIADDAFGSTEYQPRLAEEWASELDGALRCLDHEHWFIWTSRTAPLERALKKMNLEGRAERFPDPAQITVDATLLSRREKALMLYRHARTGQLTDEQKEIIRDTAHSIVMSPHFTPKRVHRFVTTWLRGHDLGAPIALLRAAVQDEIRAPTEAMRKSFDALPDTHKAFLVAMLDSDRLEALATDRYQELRSISAERDGGAAAQTTTPAQIVRELDGHFITVRQSAGAAWMSAGERRIYQLLKPNARDTVTTVEWTHPSWRDLVIDYLGEMPEQRRAFLASTKVPGLELALSTAGGARGERSRPLLRTPEDWTALEARIAPLVEEVSVEQLPGVIVTLQEAMSLATDTSDEETLATWARTVLSITARRWQGTSLMAAELAKYLELSERMRPLPPVPDLSATWTDHVSSCRTELAASSVIIAEQFVDTRAWLRVIRLIAGSEPRFLRQVGFPAEYEGLLTQIVDALDEVLNYVAGIEPDTITKIQRQVALLEACVDTATFLVDLSPSEGTRARDLLKKARRLHAHDRKQLDRLTEKESSELSASQPSDGDRIAIAQVFDDL